MTVLTVDRVGGGALALLAVLVLWESRALPLGVWRNPGPAAMPVVLALGALVLGVLIALGGGRSEPLAAVGWGEARHALVILGACAFAALALERLGYRLTMFLLLAFLVRAVERWSLPAAVAFGVGLAWGSFYLFNTLLRVPLPRGPWGL